VLIEAVKLGLADAKVVVADLTAQEAAIPHPNDTQALLKFLEKYSYDRVGNITQLTHTTSQANGTAGPSNTIWTRNYSYEDASNRLLSNNAPDPLGNPATATFTYTGNGAMRKMAHLPVIEWDYADRMRHTNMVGGGDAFFTYDSGGQRVRKVWAHGQLDERIYVSGWETFRSRTGGTMASPVTLERETLHVMDGQRRVAMVETTTVGTGPTGPRWRFQLGNALSSAVLELDAQGRVKITDRKKEIIVTNGGKNVAPQPIENLLRADQYIEQAVLIGDHRNFISVILVPHFPTLRHWAQHKHLAFESDAELAALPEVKAKLMREVEHVNAKLSKYERVRRIIVLDQEMTPENGLLTPSLKVKRRAVATAFKERIDTVYGSNTVEIR